MKGGIVLGLALTATTLVLGGTGTLAAQHGDASAIKRSVTILRDATLGGHALASGTYEAEITGGDDATLVLKHDRREVARVRVHRTELAAPAKYDRVDVRSRTSGKEVVAVYFKGDLGSFEVVDDQGVAIAEKP